MSTHGARMSIESKLKTLKALLASLDRAALAYSGGVDSHFLLSVASEVMGSNLMAVTGISELYAEEERRFAREQIEASGIRHRFLEFSVFDHREIIENSANRCYECKVRLFRQIKALSKKEGYPVVIEGSNADDISDYRPGMKALKELGIRSPLLEVGLSKAEIRSLSRSMSLPTWTKPSLACLATRIPYNTPLTRESLKRVDRAESILRKAGYDQVRVRDYGSLAKIELNPGVITDFMQNTDKKDIVRALKDLGYASVALDLEGYVTGKMNQEILDNG